MGVGRSLWSDGREGNHERFMCFLCNEVASVSRASLSRARGAIYSMMSECIVK